MLCILIAVFIVQEVIILCLPAALFFEKYVKAGSP
ncbi:MAG: hypothetical protein K0S24_3341 [Sphingobacterium sp.]|jgi:hypothetical protein|nr:hypothetical protein [Sphingobacterium sp.]